jgi:hypothetical protein
MAEQRADVGVGVEVGLVGDIDAVSLQEVNKRELPVQRVLGR